MIGPWKMRAVGTFTFMNTYTSPLMEMITKRPNQWDQEDTIVFYENGFGKRKAKATNDELLKQALIIRWLEGGPLPRGVTPIDRPSR